MELLLPAGSLAHTFAAFDYGGDACYLGIGNLNARAGASNFTVEDYRKALAFARSREKKLYITFNTLLKNCELETIFKTLDSIYDLLPDGVIVQDIGLASMIKREFPKVPLIASTQMGFHNVSGVKFAEDFGFKRVILSRELTLKEIEIIRKSSTIELEVFIHGAICFSFSGYCFASSFIGGNSGNRGRCSQVCRMFFRGDIDGFIFNLKDLAGFDFVKKLYEIGIDSLKVEGRLKDELYVAVNASVYRKFIDEAAGKVKLKESEKEEFKKLSAIVFSRKRWSGYFPSDHPENCIDPSFPGNYGLFIGRVVESKGNRITVDRLSFPLNRHDGILIFEENEPVPVKVLNVRGREITISTKRKFKKGSSVYLVHSVKVQNRFPVRNYNVSPLKPTVCLSIELNSETVTVDVFNPVREVKKRYVFPVQTEPPQKNPITVDDVTGEFKKSGNFSFAASVENVKIDGSFFIRRSELSSIRKKIFSIVEEELFPKKEYRLPAFTHLKRRKPSAVFVVDETNAAEFLKFAASIGKPFVVFLKTTNFNLFRDFMANRISVGVAMPLILKTYEEESFYSFVKRAVKAGIKNFLVSHYYGLKMVEKFKDINLFADFTLYTLNRESANFLKKKMDYLTISVEDELENIISLSDCVDVITIYQDTPLFQSQVCLYKVFATCPGVNMVPFHMCLQNYRITKITGRFKDNFEIHFENCRTVLLWNKPLNLNKIRRKIPSFIPRFDFVYKKYSFKDMEKIFSGKVFSGHTGNVLRGLA
ncbi:peptidase U32 family protein [Desulfurobacterium sp. TC5-1]|uniref:peptidase U32 family protein n=1 Tax=Desulfurobacterium sp. TC5-1 TaxID=1158318 RepID=UPI0003B6BB17|nr:peptidase U32 family protein [Desulfurobacterium sp. TC5-1]